jgi:hypothetical protein
MGITSFSRVRVNSGALLALSFILTLRVYISTSLVGLVRGLSIEGAYVKNFR